MSDIDIPRRHDLGIDRAREIVSGIAVAMQRKFSIESAWDGDVLRIRRSGVEGWIEVGVDHVHVRVRLGMMLGMFKAAIEEEIRRRLDEHFA